MLYVLIILFFSAITICVVILVDSRQTEKKHQENLAAIARLKPDVEDAFSEIGKYYNFSHYITETERLMLEEKYDALYQEVKPLIGSKALGECPDKESFQRFYTAMSDTKAH